MEIQTLCTQITLIGLLGVSLGHIVGYLLMESGLPMVKIISSPLLLMEVSVEHIIILATD